MNLHFGSTVDTSGRNCLTELFPRLLYAHQFSMLQYPNTQEDDLDIIEYSNAKVFEKFVGMKALVLTRKQ